MSPVLVWFKDDAYHQLEPPNLEINWDPFNLTMNKDAKVGNLQFITSNIKQNFLFLNLRIYSTFYGIHERLS